MLILGKQRGTVRANNSDLIVITDNLKKTWYLSLVLMYAKEKGKKNP